MDFANSQCHFRLGVTMSINVKNFISEYLENNRNDYTQISDAIHEFNEIGFKEFKSAKIQKDYLESKGFKINSGLAKMETAFSAEYGNGGPVIALLGEFDALEGLGHGCGHHLLGTGCVAAAVAIKEYLEAEKAAGKDVKGTVRFYACPAEESGSGKMFLAKDGYFDDVDVALAWHPGNGNGVARTGCLANYQVFYNFHGKSSHAAAVPELGRSALDAVELLDIGVNYLREHIPETARIHYAITNTGGHAPNVVQSEAQVYYMIRAEEQETAKELYERVNKVAQGAALMTETTEDHVILATYANYIPNTVLGDLVEDKAAEYYPDVRNHVDRPGAGKGSTDVGDVSWVVPTAYFHLATWTPGTPGHSQSIVDQGKTQKAYDGMINSAKIMAETAAEIFANPEIVEKAKEEHKNRLGGKVYNPGVPADIIPGAVSI